MHGESQKWKLFDGRIFFKRFFNNNNSTWQYIEGHIAQVYNTHPVRATNLGHRS